MSGPWVNHIEGYAGNDPRLREAMWRALDAEVVNERAYQGTFNTSMSLIHPDSVWGSDDLATVDYDPERAQQLVEEATADGLSAELEILASSTPTASEGALAWEGMLEAVGFDVTVEQTPINDVVTRTFTGNLDIANASLDITPAQITTRLHGYLHSTGVNNRGKYESAEMDAAVTEAMAASNDARAAAIAQINDLYVEDFVAPVFRQHPNRHHLAGRREGHHHQPHGDLPLPRCVDRGVTPPGAPSWTRWISTTRSC